MESKEFLVKIVHNNGEEWVLLPEYSNTKGKHDRLKMTIQDYLDLARVTSSSNNISCYGIRIKDARP